MPDQHDYTELFDKFISGSLSPEERKQFYQLLSQRELPEGLNQLLLDSYKEHSTTHHWTNEFKQQWAASLATQITSKSEDNSIADSFDEGLHRISEDSLPATHKVHYLRRWSWIAASLLFIAISAYLFISGDRTSKNTMVQQEAIRKDIAPGGEKAVLTLADGRKIILDSAANGSLVDQQGVQVTKVADGRITYNQASAPHSAMGAVLNTLSTPKGGQYQVTLPDGTKAWLNAASSITFPTAFLENKRSVKIQGEVFLEVAKIKSKPFIVDIDGKAAVEVLGTSFNISAYADETVINTSLVDGSIKIIRGAQAMVLKPGNQAVMNRMTHGNAEAPIAASIETQPFDADQVLAWKNGIFNFNGADVKTAMRQLERWYDIQVEYEGPVSNEKFKGEMYRNVNLSDVLEMLERMGVQFKLQGKKLIVH